MIDREKVIIVLNECKMKEPDVDFCIKCPYETDANHMCFEFLLNDAIALLKEQEAVEPINSYGTFRCGNCKNIVGYNDGYGRGYQNNYCSKCGQVVKWDEQP